MLAASGPSATRSRLGGYRTMDACGLSCSNDYSEQRNHRYWTRTPHVECLWITRLRTTWQLLLPVFQKIQNNATVRYQVAKLMMLPNMDTTRTWGASGFYVSEPSNCQYLILEGHQTLDASGLDDSQQWGCWYWAVKIPNVVCLWTWRLRTIQLLMLTS